MKLGFTGTQKGLKEIQREKLGSVLVFLLEHESIEDNEFHHGDCIGADEEFHEMLVGFREVNLIPLEIIIHPPINPKKRANCQDGTVLPEKDYIDRNHDIVDVSMVMIACPFEMIERKMYSGTWATIRYSIKKNKPLIIIYPDGVCKTFNIE